MQTTFVMIKPGGVQRHLCGEIIKRFEQKGLQVCGMKMINVTKDQAQRHYAVHQDKPFYNSLVDSIMQGPVVCLAIRGEQAISIVRLMCGATNPLESQPGTIRGDFSSDLALNIVHSSDSEESAKNELAIYFSDEEILDYKQIDQEFINA